MRLILSLCRGTWLLNTVMMVGMIASLLIMLSTSVTLCGERASLQSENASEASHVFPYGQEAPLLSGINSNHGYSPREGDFLCRNTSAHSGCILISGTEERGTRDQFHPSVAVHDNGAFVVVWIDLRSSPAMLLAQRFGVAGEKIGCELLVGQIENSVFGRFIDELQPRVEILTNGAIVVAWEDNMQIYVRLFDSTGFALSDRIPVLDSEGVGNAYNPALAAGLSGGFMVVWEDERNSLLDDIYGQLFNVTAQPVGNNFKISDDTTGRDQWSSDIASDFSGRFFVVWQDGRNDSINEPEVGDSSDIYFQALDSNGHAIGTNGRISDTTHSSLGYRPHIVCDNQGNYTILWVTLDNTLRLCRLNDGNRIYGPMDPIPGYKAYTTRNPQTAVAIGLHDRGDVTIAWVQRRNPTILTDIFTCTVDTNGITTWAPTPITDIQAKLFESSAALACGTSGKSTFVWVHDTSFNQGSDIQTISLDSLNMQIGKPKLVNAEGSWQYQPSMAVNKFGECSIAWIDERYIHPSDGNAISLQRFSSDGTQIDTILRISDQTNSVYNPVVGCDSAGNTVVFWNVSGSYTADVKFCSIDRNSGEKSTVSSVISDSAYYFDNLDFAGNDYRGILVWEAPYASVSGVRSKIRAQRVTYDGQPLGTMIVVSDTNWHRNPSVASQTDGSFAIVFQSNNDEIYLQLFDSSGTKLGGLISVGDSATYGLSERSRPQIAADGGGHYRVVWSESSVAGTAIVSCMLTAAGTVIVPVHAVATPTQPPDQYSSIALAIDQFSRLAIVWDDPLDINRRQITCQLLGSEDEMLGSPIDISCLTGVDNFQFASSACFAGTKLCTAWQNVQERWDSDIWGNFVDLDATATHDRPVIIPSTFSLDQNYPNPFNPTTTINFNLPKAQHVRLEIYNVLGQKLITLFEGKLGVGLHRFTWDGKSAHGGSTASGIYYYRLYADDYVETKKMMLLK
jgi:FlgD Ig-like domain